MEHVPAMVDMKRDVEKDNLPGIMCEYPSGLYVTFDDEVLDKLNLDGEEVQVGDFLHMHVMAKVTGVSASEHETMGSRRCINLVMAFISAEDEQKEDAEEERAEMMPTKVRTSKFYTKG